MEKFTIEANQVLSKDVVSFFHCDYTGMGKENNPNYLNVVKNDNGTDRTDYRGVHMDLSDACKMLEDVLLKDLSQLRNIFGKNVTICSIPRSKAENKYKPSQLMLKKIISKVSRQLGFEDGTGYIIRTVDTQTTHLKFRVQNGKSPYKGITKETCILSDNIKGKIILLIDDIYTKTVNIDEDCLQALLEEGAKSVYFYAIGRTV